MDTEWGEEGSSMLTNPRRIYNADIQIINTVYRGTDNAMFCRQYLRHSLNYISRKIICIYREKVPQKVHICH